MWKQSWTGLLGIIWNVYFNEHNSLAREFEIGDFVAIKNVDTSNVMWWIIVKFFCFWAMRRYSSCLIKMVKILVCCNMISTMSVIGVVQMIWDSMRWNYSSNSILAHTWYLHTSIFATYFFFFRYVLSTCNIQIFNSILATFLSCSFILVLFTFSLTK